MGYTWEHLVLELQIILNRVAMSIYCLYCLNTHWPAVPHSNNMPNIILFRVNCCLNTCKSNTFTQSRIQSQDFLSIRQQSTNNNDLVTTFPDTKRFIHGQTKSICIQFWLQWLLNKPYKGGEDANPLMKKLCIERYQSSLKLAALPPNTWAVCARLEFQIKKEIKLDR